MDLGTFILWEQFRNISLNIQYEFLTGRCRNLNVASKLQGLGILVFETELLLSRCEQLPGYAAPPNVPAVLRVRNPQKVTTLRRIEESLKAAALLEASLTTSLRRSLSALSSQSETALPPLSLPGDVTEFMDAGTRQWYILRRVLQQLEALVLSFPFKKALACLREASLDYPHLYALFFTLHSFKLTSEFPNNFRHSCTTMPWTIWPALVVLWGVCWMFNTEEFDDIAYESFEQAMQDGSFWPTEQDNRFDLSMCPQDGFAEIGASQLDFVNSDLDRTNRETMDRDPNPGSSTMRNLVSREKACELEDVVAATDEAFDPSTREPGTTQSADDRLPQSTAMDCTSSSISLTQTIDPGIMARLCAQRSAIQKLNTQTTHDNENSATTGSGLPGHVPISTIGNTQSSTQATNDSGYTCSECDKRLSRKEDLNRHKLSHKKGRFPCLHRDCPRNKKPFTRSDNRNVHMRKIHSAYRASESRDVVQTPLNDDSQTPPRQPEDPMSHIGPLPQTSQSEKRGRHDSHSNEPNVEDMHEKCRRLEAQVTRLESENKRLRDVVRYLLG